jgi:hypothetical protein
LPRIHVDNTWSLVTWDQVTLANVSSPGDYTMIVLETSDHIS